jgi:hypothetical protein
MDDHSYVFYGRVVPERALIDIAEVGFGIPASSDVPAGKLFIEIIKSQISARYLGDDEVKNLFTLRNIVEDAVRTLLDIAGYYAGYGYDAEIVQLVRPSSPEKLVFGIDVPALSGLVKRAGITMNDIFHLLSKPEGSYLRHALADTREAIKSPRDTGFFCYRAIESLKNCCAIRNNLASDKDQAWELFRTTYSVDKDEIMSIKTFADPVRHGNSMEAKPLSDGKRAEIFEKTWNIINQYILKEKNNAP